MCYEACLAPMGWYWFNVNNHYSRISRFYNDFDGKSYGRFIRDLKSRVKKSIIEYKSNEWFTENKPQSFAEIIESIMPRDANCFQWSHIMSGVYENPKERFNKIYHNFIISNEDVVHRQGITEDDIWHKFRGYIPSSSIRVKDKVKEGFPIKSKHLDYNFKLGWENGKINVFEPISLDYKSETHIIEKALQWGGRLSNLGKNNDIDLTIAIGEPQLARSKKAAGRAKDILLDIKQVKNILYENEYKDYINDMEKQLI